MWRTQTASKVWACHAIQKGTPLSSGWWILQSMLDFPWEVFLMLATYPFFIVPLSQPLCKGTLSFQSEISFLFKHAGFFSSISPQDCLGKKIWVAIHFYPARLSLLIAGTITRVFLQSPRQKFMINFEYQDYFLIGEGHVYSFLEWQEGEGVISIQGTCVYVESWGKVMSNVDSREAHYSGKCLKRWYSALLS